MIQERYAKSLDQAPLEPVSIIIPALNEEKYIGKLLGCLARQTYKNFEVIVVDGKSEDRTRAVVHKFKDILNLKLLNAKKRNISFQRNEGARHAKFGRLIFFDADVIVGDEWLEKTLRELHKNKGELASCHLVPLSSRWYYHVFTIIMNFTFKITAPFKPCGTGMCIISTKKLHQKINGFREKILFFEDLDYFQIAGKIAKYSFLTPTVYYSIRRFEQEGTRKTMKKWLLAYYYMLTNKIEKSNKIPYEQGIY